MHFEEGSAFLERQKEVYDFIVFDLTDPWEGQQWSSALLTEKGMRLAYQALRAGGVLVLHAGSPMIHSKHIVAKHKLLASIFNKTITTTAHIVSYGGPWNFLAGQK